jgi:glycine/D-amino acid oxidase-like deaminating enzyme
VDASSTTPIPTISARPTTDFIDAVRRRLSTRIPALADAPYARGHAGIYDVTPDQRPVLDEIPGISGLYVAAGFSGTGFKTAPAVGAAMAELITTGATTIADPSVIVSAAKIYAKRFDREARPRVSP